MGIGVIAQGHVGEQLKVVAGILPKEISAQELGTGFSRVGFNAALVTIQTGVVSGSPTSSSVEVEVQESLDDGATYGSIATANLGKGKAVESIATPAGSKTAKLFVDLRLVGTKVRVIATPTFVGGSTPKVPISAAVALVPENETPAETDTGV